MSAVCVRMYELLHEMARRRGWWASFRCRVMNGHRANGDSNGDSNRDSKDRRNDDQQTNRDMAICCAHPQPARIGPQVDGNAPKGTATGTAT